MEQDITDCEEKDKTNWHSISRATIFGNLCTLGMQVEENMINISEPLFLWTWWKRFVRDSHVMLKKQFSNSKAFQSHKNNYSLCPRTLKKMPIFHPSRMENCRLDFDTRDKFTVDVVASKIAPVIYCYLSLCAMSRNETTTNISPLPESTANSGIKHATTEAI